MPWSSMIIRSRNRHVLTYLQISVQMTWSKVAWTQFEFKQPLTTLLELGTNVQCEHPYYRGRTIYRAEILVSRNLFVQVKIYILLPCPWHLQEAQSNVVRTIWLSKKYAQGLHLSSIFLTMPLHTPPAPLHIIASASLQLHEREVPAIYIHISWPTV